MTDVSRIAVCGLGKLGLPIAAVFAASDLKVVGFDVIAEKVKMVNNGNVPRGEADLAEYLALASVKANLKATENVVEAVAESDACLFVTPTPSVGDGSFDHHYLFSAVTTFASEVARQHRRKYLFIINSTVMPGVSAWEITPILTGFLGDLGFHLAYKPEFIALGTVVRDLHYPSVIMVGSSCEAAGERVEALYRKMVMGAPPVKHLSLVEAELAKISLNCAVTMKISFANQIGLVARKFGADPHRVLDAVGADPRVGPAALRFGLPFGGPCFPRDNKMFQRAAALMNEGAPLAAATDVVNQLVLRRVVENVLETHGDIGILGLAYKPGTNVMDEAPGLIWRKALTLRGRKVKAHDPWAPHQHSIEEVLACPTVIVACAWPEYRGLTVAPGTLLIDPMGVLQVNGVAPAIKEAEGEKVLRGGLSELSL